MQLFNTSQKNIEQWTCVFHLLGNPITFKILLLLKGKPMCVCEIAEALNVRQPCISQHLSKLRKNKIASYSREGWNKKYFITSREINFLFDRIQVDLEDDKK